MSLNLGQPTAEIRGRSNSDLSQVADLKAMISRNKEAIFMDNGKFQSHLLQDNAKVIVPSRNKNLKNIKN